MPDTPDVSRLSLGMSLTPSPQVTGKRAREEDEWDPADIEVLQNVSGTEQLFMSRVALTPSQILSRPPKAALYPPGSMPPPTVLDELTTAVVDQLGGRERAGREGRAAIVVDDPMTGSGSSSSDASDEPSSPAWSHSWEDTRRMLTTLALEDTRLGAERADRKLSRQERLARPGVRRVDSMDFLNDASNESSPNERLGRVLR